MMNWLKAKLLGGLREAAVREINGLDKYQDELAGLIRKYADADKCSAAVIDFVQAKARAILDKVWKQ